MALKTTLCSQKLIEPLKVSEPRKGIHCVLETVNQCCVSHDKCYDDQLGRKHCDDTFCDCLDRVTRGYEVCNKEDGPLFCGMVRQFGADAYLRSGNHTVALEESQDEIIHAAPNNTNTNSSSSHDYDYESAVR
ncbi:hypothetical protein NECAME_12239 [Necator americanus]|uniref:Phospholipase A2 n=1 Tax=Necator americanus TaxID=51031 RepID=W2T3R2_NECAM|nr:hypothetical protein NECAME_12239 [Necator americanus]ETN75617.1 hypothetical protein NECAME_12239 [Necator americanus]